MTVEFDELIDAIVAIGNHKRTTELCEPKVMQPLSLEAWMVKRALVAWGLFCDESHKGAE